MLNKVRLIIFLVVVLPMLVCGLAFAAYQFVAGKGHVTFVAPGDAELTYSVDHGPKQVLAAGAHHKLELEQGRHTLEFDSSYGQATRPVEVANGFTRLLVPADDEQCFVVLDVSRSHYTYGSKAADKYPTVKRRVKASEVVDLPSSTYFDEDQMPKSIKEGDSCNLLVEIECDELSQSDQALMTSLGL